MGDLLLDVGFEMGALVEGVGPGLRVSAAGGRGLLAEPDDAAVGALGEAGLLEDLDIAADGRLRNAEFRDERVEIGHSPPAEQVFELGLAFCDEHVSSLRTVTNIGLWRGRGEGPDDGGDGRGH